MFSELKLAYWLCTIIHDVIIWFDNCRGWFMPGCSIIILVSSTNGCMYRLYEYWVVGH